MKKLLLWLLIFLSPVSVANAALTIDGSATSSLTNVALSTTKTNDIIIAFLNCATVSSTCTITGISDTAGLTWTKRTGSQQTLLSFDIWYAKAPSILTSDTITMASTGGSSQRIFVFGVNGANFATPFDTNGAVPTSSTGTVATTLSNTISTTNANTMLLAAVRSTNSLGTITEPSGFAAILSAGANEDVSYQVVSSAQTSLTETYSWTGATVRSIMLSDALQAAPATVPGMLLDTAF